MSSEIALQSSESTMQVGKWGAVSKKAGNATGQPGVTRFEQARILGARALQISLGAPILVDAPPEVIDPLILAEMEFQSGAIPITVVHRKPGTAG